jgi:MFS family permease
MPPLVGPLLWLVLRAVVGFGCAGLFITTESWLNAKARQDRRPAAKRGAAAVRQPSRALLSSDGSAHMLTLLLEDRGYWEGVGAVAEPWGEPDVETKWPDSS